MDARRKQNNSHWEICCPLFFPEILIAGRVRRVLGFVSFHNQFIISPLLKKKKKKKISKQVGVISDENELPPPPEFQTLFKLLVLRPWPAPLDPNPGSASERLGSGHAASREPVTSRPRGMLSKSSKANKRWGMFMNINEAQLLPNMQILRNFSQKQSDIDLWHLSHTLPQIPMISVSAKFGKK